MLMLKKCVIHDKLTSVKNAKKSLFLLKITGSVASVSRSQNI